MSHTLWIDLETRSRVDLKATNAYRYAADPDFAILMASWSYDRSPIVTTTDPDAISDIPGLFDPNTVKVAHNAPFERICISAHSGLEPGTYLDPEHYHDTMVIARELGYPASLDNVARALGATPKDAAGSALIRFFCVPRRDGKFNTAEDDPVKWAQFIAYCEQDVGTLVEVYDLLEEQGGWPTPAERDAYLADQRINDRGIAIDLALCRKAMTVAGAATEEQKEEFRATTLWEVDNPGSVPQVKSWLEDRGAPLPNLQKETVEVALRGDLAPDVRKALEIRQELALAAPAKFTAAYRSHVGGRLRGTLSYFGAHTGRWAGRGTQIHNLPRDTFKPEGEDAEAIDLLKDIGTPKPEVEAAEQAIIDRMTDEALTTLHSGGYTPASVLKKLVRPMFTLGTPDCDAGVVVDYSAIEAVVIAWLGGEEWMMEAFRQGRDIYVETAGRMGPEYTRAQGKIASLAFGFNGGSGSLKAMATDKDVITVDGVPIKLALVPDEVLYEMFVWPWRNASPNIVRLWSRLDARFRTGGAVGEHLTFERVNGNRDRLLRLPSGRAIAYRKAGIQTKRKWNKFKEEWEDRKVLTFQSAARFPGRDETYGGRLAENATQAVARDLLAAGIVRLENEGLQVVGHVHDEILVQGTRDEAAVREIMCTLPDWATGLPVSGDGFTTYRYKKG